MSKAEFERLKNLGLTLPEPIKEAMTKDIIIEPFNQGFQVFRKYKMVGLILVNSAWETDEQGEAMKFIPLVIDRLGTWAELNTCQSLNEAKEVFTSYVD